MEGSPLNRIFALAAGLMLLAPGAVCAQVAWEGAAGVDYSRGDYGGAQDTEFSSVSATLRATTGRWRFEAIAPYYHLKGPEGSVSGGVIIPGGGPVSSRSGFGDVSLGATYQLFEPVAGGTTLEIGGLVKLPTAKDGLGTGEADYSLQMTLRRPLGERLTAVIGAGYQWLGDPVAFELKDGPTALAGLDYAVSDRVNVGALVNYRSAYIGGLEDPLQVNPYAILRSGGPWSVVGYGTVGLSSASPDFGGGMILTRAF